MSRLQFVAGICPLIILGILGGCNNSDESFVETEVAQRVEDPLERLRNAASEERWADASLLIKPVLTVHAGDPDVLALVARVAHFSGDVQLACEVMRDACAVEAYKDPGRNQQAMLAMLASGRLFDAMSFLESVAAAAPEQTELRRTLFDFYIGCERRLSAQPHGEALIRQRKFDRDLLLGMADTSRRDFDWKPLKQMVDRNPQDCRPLIGRARKLVDQGDMSDAIDILTQITTQHPEDGRAVALHARYLANTARYEELVPFIATYHAPGQAEPEFWVAIGELALVNREIDQAIRAYWEATQRDPNLTEAWLKLATAIQQGADPESRDKLVSIVGRGQALSELDRYVAEFRQRGMNSVELVLKIASLLERLGRVWEAEAWAAVALTMAPTQNDVRLKEQVVELRKGIVSRMTSDMPLQIRDNQPALMVDLSRFPMPVARDGSSVTPTPSRVVASQPQPVLPPAIRLLDEAKQRGIDFLGTTRSGQEQVGAMIYEILGCGGATIDFDLNGWPDLYLATAGGTPGKNDSGANALFINRGGQFTDVTPFAATGDTGFAQGATSGDLNEDGFTDLVVFNYGRNVLYINNGDGTFTNRSEILENHAQSRWASSGAVADIDGDGISDLVVLHYAKGDDVLTLKCPDDHAVMRSCSPVAFPADEAQFYNSDATGRLHDVTQRWRARPEMPGRGLGILVGEFDNSKGLDLYVANDQSNNHYWTGVNDPSGFYLSESGLLRGVAVNERSLSQGSMGMAVADFDGDQDADFYVTNFLDEYNTYYDQTSFGVWTDVTAIKRLMTPTLPMIGWGTTAIDFNNDGRLELMVVNGHVDTHLYNEKTSQVEVQDQLAQLFWMDEDSSFQIADVGSTSPYFQAKHFGRALWASDLNVDGRMDLVVSHLNEPVAILINQDRDPTHWVDVRLVGTDGSREAVGAVVQLDQGERQQTQWVTSGAGYLSDGGRTLHFGIPPGIEWVDLKIVWPSGSEQTLSRVPVDRSVLIVQGQDAFTMP